MGTAARSEISLLKCCFVRSTRNRGEHGVTLVKVDEPEGRGSGAAAGLRRRRVSKREGDGAFEVREPAQSKGTGRDINRLCAREVECVMAAGSITRPARK
jgi:hypothetical protein